MKRAITLAGGGPAAGLHIGALQRLGEAGITFDVWALSCIGAWVGIVYNQCDRGWEIEQTYDFFKNNVFRDDVSYSRFPINRASGPDWFGNMRALMTYVSDHRSYENLWLPDQIIESYKETLALLLDPRKWNEGDINQWFLNHALAPNPFVRHLTSLMYLSNVTGSRESTIPIARF
jgi:Patatin-like phospholipase